MGTEDVYTGLKTNGVRLLNSYISIILFTCAPFGMCECEYIITGTQKMSWNDAGLHGCFQDGNSSRRSG